MFVARERTEHSSQMTISAGGISAQYQHIFSWGRTEFVDASTTNTTQASRHPACLTARCAIIHQYTDGREGSDGLNGLNGLDGLDGLDTGVRMM